MFDIGIVLEPVLDTDTFTYSIQLAGLPGPITYVPTSRAGWVPEEIALMPRRKPTMAEVMAGTRDGEQVLPEDPAKGAPQQIQDLMVEAFLCAQNDSRWILMPTYNPDETLAGFIFGQKDFVFWNLRLYPEEGYTPGKGLQ